MAFLVILILITIATKLQLKAEIPSYYRKGNGKLLYSLSNEIVFLPNLILKKMDMICTATDQYYFVIWCH